jgi:hypothetical protein
MTIAGNLETLKGYAGAVRGRIDHHANSVRSVFPALLGYVLCYAEHIELREGRTAVFGNVAWFRTPAHHHRYAFSYNHADETIELRDHSVCGKVIASFNNDTPLDDIANVFANLR